MSDTERLLVPTNDRGGPARRCGDVATHNGDDLRANASQPGARAGLRVGDDRGHAAADPALDRGRELAYTPDFVVSVLETFNYWIGGWRMQVAFLGAPQVDRPANLNTATVGR